LGGIRVCERHSTLIYKLHSLEDGKDFPAIFAEAGRGGHGTGTWYLWYWANRVTGFSGGHLLPLAIACVLTEEGTATLGYLANSAGEGGGHVFVERTMDGYLATGCCIGKLQQSSV
jgi:hypothetical protein